MLGCTHQNFNVMSVDQINKIKTGTVCWGFVYTTFHQDVHKGEFGYVFFIKFRINTANELNFWYEYRIQIVAM
jgi:hypothetical protein